MNIKLIVSDLDNTLLNKEKLISPQNNYALKLCRDKGIKIAFASARNRKSILQYAQTTPIDGAVCSNGCLVYEKGNLLGERLTADSRQSLHIINGILAEYPYIKIWLPIFDLEKNIVFTTDADYSAAMWGDAEIRNDFEKIVDFNIYRFMIHVDNKEQVNYINSLLPDEMNSVLHEGKHLMIGNKKANKMRGISLLANFWQIDPSEIVCFGDDFNDVEMMKGCGHSVAMGNAIDEVKKYAKHSTDTNENNGVAQFLEQYVL